MNGKSSFSSIPRLAPCKSTWWVILTAQETGKRSEDIFYVSVKNATVLTETKHIYV